MKKLLVLSMYASNTDQNKKWYELQRWFLNETTKEYGFCALSREKYDFFSDCQWVQVTQEDNREHTSGLRAISRIIQNGKYEYYLILDSDAFPVKRNWMQALIQNLKRFNKKYAAVVRTENLDTFPHVCVLFTSCSNSSLVSKMYHDKKITHNLLYKKLSDHGVSLAKDSLLPLIKSNAKSYHPAFCTVYSNMFYHHVAGSRNPKTRSLKYWTEFMDLDSEGIHRKCTSFLFSDPAKFINSLLGEKRF